MEPRLTVRVAPPTRVATTLADGWSGWSQPESVGQHHYPSCLRFKNTCDNVTW